MTPETAELRLSYTQLDDRLGELDATAHSQSFSGHSYTHVSPQAMKEFARALRAFPIVAATTPTIQASTLWSDPAIAGDGLGIEIAPHNSRGTLIVRVDLCTRQHSVTIRFLTDYSAIERFASDIEAMLAGNQSEVVLKNTTT
jgi:hypothetical protein